MLRWRSWEMAALALLEDIANGRSRRERVFRDHYDFLAHDDDWLISRFRFPRAVLLELCAEFGPVLERDTARSRQFLYRLTVVERAIGQLKSRWRCLDRTGGMLLYRPEKVCRIVRACGVLHNVAHRTAVVRTRPVGRTSAAGRCGALEVSVTPDVLGTLEEHPKSVAAG
ncbi:hypothetical protein MHYP_G00019690 [Metynnis hypsauchen]